MRPTALLPLAATTATASLNASSSSFPSFTYDFGQVGTSDLALQPNPLSTQNFHQPSAGSSRGGLAQCISGYVDVPASTTRNLKLNFQLPVNQSQVTETFVDMVSSGSPFMKQIMGGMQSAGGNWSLGATLCVPRNDSAPQGVQLLTHGVGFDRYYWDFAPGYSYVDVAAAHGYATFFYDRLSVGVSQKADPIQTVQAPLEVAIAHTLASQLRAGKYGNCAFSTVVGVGHSFGSIITQAVTADYPSALDAAILTGFSVNSTGLPVFTIGNDFALANMNQPYRFGQLDNGYLVANTITNNQIAFFRAPGFDPVVLALADATKGTVTFGEFFTTTAPTKPAMDFTGPVAVVDGAEDLPFCSGNCSYPVDLAAAVKPMLYAGLEARKFASYLAPVTGHGVNLHYSAGEAFEWIQAFLAGQGLGM
ncbi:hypothetical protein EJ03DRAFT_322631 [Teratosphaeria nubilosa]|uniref:AB hydrolase-1 domain-containing protein n=1 Tax=Teratosphaeria nubilosa TaxID=161662 RepID=A0A6G1KSH6_9PEZI|nr:hypothetical protein EJ03DRAFT_322631 [Teratosphaeria nubilosa]